MGSVRGTLILIYPHELHTTEHTHKLLSETTSHPNLSYHITNHITLVVDRWREISLGTYMRTCRLTIPCVPTQPVTCVVVELGIMHGKRVVCLHLCWVTYAGWGMDVCGGGVVVHRPVGWLK